MTNTNLIAKQRRISAVKAALIAFVRDVQLGGTYMLELDATDMLDMKRIISQDEAVERAQNFVHRMRVELARRRQQVRNKNHVPKQFKMLLTEVRIEGTKLLVTLMKAESGITGAQADVDAAFESLKGGEIIK